MLRSSETWQLTKTSLQYLQRNGMAMIRHICNIKSKDVTTVCSKDLTSNLEFKNLDLLSRKRVCWLGHVERANGAVRTAFSIQVAERRWPGRPKMV